MLLLDLTLDSAAANVALDEALLRWAEWRANGEDDEVLRFWESPTPTVVMGRSSGDDDEVFVERCRGAEVPHPYGRTCRSVRSTYGFLL